MSSKFRFVAVLLAVLLAASSTQNVFAAVVDQKQEILGPTYSIGAFQPEGQEFQPSLPILEAVEVYIRTINPGWGGDTITVTIRQGSIAGTVLATAAISLAEGFEGWVYFTLGSVSVTPGSTYVIQISNTKPTFGWRGASSNPYPLGMAIQSGSLQPSIDFAFRTYAASSSAVGGVVLPNNTFTVLAPYLAMIGLVATAAVAIKKRRK